MGGLHLRAPLGAELRIVVNIIHTHTHIQNVSRIITCSVIAIADYDEDCFYDDSWRNNVIIARETLSSFLTQLHVVSGGVCVVCLFCR